MWQPDLLTDTLLCSRSHFEAICGQYGAPRHGERLAVCDGARAEQGVAVAERLLVVNEDKIDYGCALGVRAEVGPEGFS